MLRDDAGISKVRALKQIAVQRIGIQRRALCNQIPHCTPIDGRRLPKQIPSAVTDDFRGGVTFLQLALRIRGNHIGMECAFVVRTDANDSGEALSGLT